MIVRNRIAPVEHARNQEYTHRVNVAKGWYDTPVSLTGAMGLLVTEIVEVNDAGHVGPCLASQKPDPEMASEFADCYIRLLDYCSRFHVDLGVVIDAYKHTYSKRVGWSFHEVCMNLVRRVRDIIEAYRVEGLDADGGVGPDTRKAIAHFYLQLQDTCDDFNVDLPSEFSLKMAVNEARPYRHGNKHA